MGAVRPLGILDAEWPALLDATIGGGAGICGSPFAALHAADRGDRKRRSPFLELRAADHGEGAGA